MALFGRLVMIESIKERIDSCSSQAEIRYPSLQFPIFSAETKLSSCHSIIILFCSVQSLSEFLVWSYHLKHLLQGTGKQTIGFRW